MRRFLAVIVLYGMAPDESASYQSLLRARSQIGAEELDLTILLHDNSPIAVSRPTLPAGVFHHRDASNSGIARAYNNALTMALDCRYEWLLTLDQDTDLPENTLQIYLDAIRSLDARPDVAAIVPQIRAQGRIVSPNFFALGAWPRWFPSGYVGIPSQQVFAFNSASLLRVSALRQVGGYSPWFWLDNSDSFLYRQLAKYGKQVFIEGRLEVNHSFSMMNMQQNVSPDRYQTILLAESAFWDLEMNFLAGWDRTLRLVVRMFKHWRRRDSPVLRQLTRRALLLRLFRSRASRIARWRQATEQRFGAVPNAVAPSSRPKVSVCMAACNGEKYILPQLRSILPQLESGDEIIIVDDASVDDTPALVTGLMQTLADSMHAPRILLLRHTHNHGVVKTFDQAIRSATGDILFLSDQDDLWAPDKVQKVLGAFDKHPDAQIVATGFSVIDDQDRPVANSPLNANRKFSVSLAANFWHNQFQGAAIAFRSSFVQQILPFPTGRLFLHDRWIGARSILRKAETHFLDEPLLLYRQHPDNYTRRYSKAKQFLLRLQLFSDLVRLSRQRL
jgi:glycosyltransferase involved in cell wall biosynthesis